jgi:hypothetical protein
MTKASELFRMEKRMSAFPERSASESDKAVFPRTEEKRPPATARRADAAQSDLLAQYGIIAVPLTSYEWGGFRYTNAHDAIAAAKRGAAE